MINFLEVSDADIKQLDDVSFRELIARLSEAEVKSAGHSTCSVTWGGDQRAKDGGIDVRISLQEGQQIAGYIPHPQTGIQVKAQDMPRGAIVSEMMVGGQLKPSIAELANMNGAYIIASSKGSVADRALAERKAAMAECITNAGLDRQIQIDFYDRRRIATWVEQHPSLIAWVRQKTGRGTAGWQPYAAWAYHESDVSAEYVTDDRTKVFAPDDKDGLTIHAAIQRLRADLSAPQKSVRLTGLSGVGKTRLLQALFDKRIKTDNPPLDVNSVLYTDISDHPDPQPTTMAEALLMRGDTALMIIDNCGADLHGRLTEYVKQNRSNLSLITVEYDIRDDQPEATQCYRLEPSSDDLIKKLLKTRHANLTEPDIETIARFSAGNARVAFALANTSNQGGDLARLEDEQLFVRLFEQKHDPDNELLIAAEICALLYSFEGESLTGDAAELPLLAGLVGISPQRFYRHVGELERRGLVQSRGRWRAILPHAIANRLAQRALQSNQKDALVESLVYGAEPRVARSFSRRLGYLHEEKIAQKLIAEWLSEGGLLGNIERLDEFGRDMFTNVAPVLPSAALDAISRATKDPAFVSVDNRERWQFARVARSIAFDPVHFDRATGILIAFAEVEPEGHNSDSTQDALKSLFYLYLSGTDAPPDMRADVIRQLLDNSDETRNRLGVSLLDAALTASNWTSHFDFDFGARKRGFGWQPKTWGDYYGWFRLFIELAIVFGSRNNQMGAVIRKTLASSFRDLWSHASMFSELEKVARTFHEIDGWPEGWYAIRRTLRFDKDRFTDEIRERLIALEKMLAPDGLVSLIRAKVLIEGFHGLDLIDKDENENASSAYARVEEEVRDLGSRAVKDGKILSEILPELVTLDNNLVWNFGQGVADAIGNPDAFLKEIRTQFQSVPESEIKIQFLLGFLHGAKRTHTNAVAEFFDNAIRDEVFGRFFPALQMCVALDERAVKRLLQSLEQDLAPTWQFRYLGYGRATDPLSIDQIGRLINAIAAKEDGWGVSFDILDMVIRCTDEKDDDYKKELRVFCRSFLTNADWSRSRGQSDYFDAVKRVIDYAVPGAEGRQTAISIVKYILDLRNGDSVGYFAENDFVKHALGPLFRHHAIAMLDEVYVPDDDGNYRVAASLIRGNRPEYGTSPIDEAPIDQVIEWCSSDPENRIPFIAANCRIFPPERNSKPLDWSDLAIALLDRAPDKAKILSLYVDKIPPMSFSGSRAAIIRKRAQLLEKLPDHVEGIDEASIQATREQLEVKAKKEEEWELECDRERNETFE